MLRVVIYTATTNEVGAIQKAASQLDEIQLVIQTPDNLETTTDIKEFCTTASTATAVVCWLHGSTDDMPGYEKLRHSLYDRDIPFIVQSSGKSRSVRDTTADETVRETVSQYLEHGGVVNFTNLVRYLATEYTEWSGSYQPPIELPTEGVYHPDYPAASYDELLANFDPHRPTVGIWFYRSHWTHENTQYIDALIRELEARDINALPVFCSPVSDNQDQHDARWVAQNWFQNGDDTIVDGVITGFMYSLSMSQRGRDSTIDIDPEDIFLRELGVPVFQVVTSMQTRSEYMGNPAGLQGFELALAVTLPEHDGNIITHPISGKEPVSGQDNIDATPTQHRPIADRVGHVAGLVQKWAELRYTHNPDKRIAIILHNYPPSDDGIGTAFGLDTQASLINFLQELQSRDYNLPKLPESGQKIIEELIEQLTGRNHWPDPQQTHVTYADYLGPDTYQDWFECLSEEVQSQIKKEWGDTPDHPIAIPGVQFGNVIITVQPPRGFNIDRSKVYHDSDLVPPHEYIGFYLWLQYRYCADAVVHFGTHGSLEWLPGKNVGLDSTSTPDQLINDLPNIYPYIINNPGEGTQAKRRSYATIVDHLTPAMTTAGTYDELEELQELANQYYTAESTSTKERSEFAKTVYNHVDELDLWTELGIKDPSSVSLETVVDRLHEYITDIKQTQIKAGLHTLGAPPTDDELVEFIVSLTRYPNNKAPSLYNTVAQCLGIDPSCITDIPQDCIPGTTKTYSAVAETIQEQCVELVTWLAKHDYNQEHIDLDLIHAKLDPIRPNNVPDSAYEQLHTVLEYICDTVYPVLMQTSQEDIQVANALEGEYIRPGGSGSPTRGGVDLLPSGRNFYTLDPRKIPAKSAWNIGQQLADEILERHVEENDTYPEEVGIVTWGTPTVRTRGETIAQILALMGVQPVWNDAGRVKDIDVIPLNTLERPRIDVTTRVSGLFRDLFPQTAGIINDAVEMVAGLNESYEDNYVKKHVEKGGSTDDTNRVFTTKPGGYGAGVNKAITESNWETGEDLAEVFMQWSGYAMKSDGAVIPAHDALQERLSRIEATVKIEDTMEQDEFDSSDWYAFHGGLQRAVTEISGSSPQAYVGDTSDPEQATVYTNTEKVRKTMRTRVLNPKWIDRMKEHGYKGAGDLSTGVDVVLGWDATTEVISDPLWEDVADTYVFNDNLREWMESVNPWAVLNISQTLLEAIDRELWDADEETEKHIQEIHLEIDRSLESSQSSREATESEN